MASSGAAMNTRIRTAIDILKQIEIAVNTNFDPPLPHENVTVNAMAFASRLECATRIWTSLAQVSELTDITKALYEIRGI